MKRRPINFGWIWAESISMYTSEFIRLLLTSVTSSLNTSNPVPLEAMHVYAITLLYHASHMMLYALGHWAVPSLLHAFFFPSFCYRLILKLSKECFSRSGLTFFDVFWQNLALFAPCGKPSVSAHVKSSLDCGPWQWHTYLLESVLLLDGCCERVFLYHGEDPPVIHHCCPPLPFYVAELTSAFFFSQNVPNCWFGHS